MGRSCSACQDDSFREVTLREKGEKGIAQRAAAYTFLHGTSTNIGSGPLTLLPRYFMQLDEPETAQHEAVAAQARAKARGLVTSRHPSFRHCSIWHGVR